MRRTFILYIILALACVSARAQRLAISNNLICDMMGSLSAGVEVPMSKRSSIDVYGCIRPWKRGVETVNKFWAIQGQYRFYTCQVMNGFYWGPYIHAGQYNIANKGIPFKFFTNLKQNRYEGWFIGGGIGVGYEYPLSKHWNIGAEIGAGYTYIDYKKSGCETCGRLLEDAGYNYWGISKLGISILYIF